METQRTSITAKETIMSRIKASLLKGIASCHFTDFKRLRKLYEKKIEEKCRHLNKEIATASYRATIEHDDLKIFMAAGWVDCSTIDELNDILICREKSKREVAEEELYLFDQAVSAIAMQMLISKA